MFGKKINKLRAKASIFFEKKKQKTFNCQSFFASFCS